MPSPERRALNSAEDHLRVVVTRLRTAAEAVKTEKPAAALTGTCVHVKSFYLAKKRDGTPDAEAIQRRDDIALLREEVEDLCGRVAVLIAQDIAK
jgi:hypothetical protein